jgi:HSP20 family molecular chaperone IbpA
LSAKWRRHKRTSKRFDITKIFKRTKDDSVSKTPRIKFTRVKKQAPSFKHEGLTVHGKRKSKEPEPLIDIFEEKDEVIVVAECSGFKGENFKAQIRNQRLTLSAGAVNRKYRKSLNLPKRVIPETIRTTYKNGVLEIRLRKVIEEKTIDKLAD